MISKKVLAVAGLSALLATPGGRSRVSSLLASARGARRRRRLQLPGGVEEFAMPLVDKRHGVQQPGTVAAADTAVDVVGEHYSEHPPGS